MKRTLKNPRTAFKRLPEGPGVYSMQGSRGQFLYIGKATNLRRRVASYFTRAHDARTLRMVSEISALTYETTDTPIEALILEAARIREHQPPWNVKEKDDKSFLCIEITKELFPRVLLVRGKDVRTGERFGPFTSASETRAAYRILRKLFHWQVHPVPERSALPRPCFDYQIGLCPGTCIGAVSVGDYRKTIRAVRLFFSGKKRQVIRVFEREMREAANRLDFERAARLRGQVFALTHIEDTALLGKESESLKREFVEKQLRIEGYDISHISGEHAVGSMVVFHGEKPVTSEYRLFKIKTVTGSHDTAMLAEILERRLKNSWPLPDAFLVDGGIGQVHVFERVLRRAQVSLPVIGIAKGPERKRNDVVGAVPVGISVETLIRVRDDAHRFARRYHVRLRDQMPSRTIQEDM